ncbi:hypothetical protein BGZ95_011567 [Linnemannia exigua]|uniref:Uncharacterized protein n=1 Tax=Linnemannia exigua TaxID=604196 RepID=A0AAD4H536_9FUNG|nr:hypothetical protein BGZ95_011567 [Linnemannia exigua]
MGLSMNQDSDAEDDDDFSQVGDNDNVNGNHHHNNNNDDDEEEEEEVFEDVYDDDDDGGVGPEDDEFEWYDWPDQSKLDDLKGFPDSEDHKEEFVDDGTQISLDYLRNPALDSDQEDEDEEKNAILGGGGDGVNGGDDAAANTPGLGTAPGENVTADGEVKKKKRKKKKKKKNMPLADDDEVEGPTEDQEVVDAEAAKIYKPTLSIDERFRLAMDNYRKERIFNAMTSQIISTYFTFGGMDPNQVAALNISDKEIDVEIDFIYVVSAFLSSFLISASGWYDAEYFTTAPKVVGGFLRYLLHRRVIPEYDTDLRLAIDIAQRAKIEAPKCQKFNTLFPDSFNETCSILYVRDFEYDTLPDDSLECMEQVAGICAAPEVELRGKEIRHMRVVSVEPLGLSNPSSSPSSKNETVAPEPGDENSKNDESTEESSRGDQAMEEGSKGNQSNTIAYSKVTLAKLPIGWATDNSTSTTKNAKQEDKSEERCTIFVSTDLANYLDIGTVVWGTFFTLSNGIVFARPLGAHPSFFVEQDEEISDA